jgi:iron complex outermembrane receptor protein
MGKVGITLPLGSGIQGSGKLRFVGSQRCQNPEMGGLDDMGSSRTADLSLRRVFGVRAPSLRRLDASIGVYNVTNALVFDQCGLPQPGRSFQIQLRIW